jgi:hypothetical protein
MEELGCAIIAISSKREHTNEYCGQENILALLQHTVRGLETSGVVVIKIVDHIPRYSIEWFSILGVILISNLCPLRRLKGKAMAMRMEDGRFDILSRVQNDKVLPAVFNSFKLQIIHKRLKNEIVHGFNVIPRESARFWACGQRCLCAGRAQVC